MPRYSPPPRSTRTLARLRLMTRKASGLATRYDDAWIIDGVRTPFVDYNGVLGLISPTDLGMKAAREIFKRYGVAASDMGTTIVGNVAQASHDTFMMPRHIGLYSGVGVD